MNRAARGFFSAMTPSSRSTSAGSPTRRAAWHAAFEALSPDHYAEIRGLSDAELLQLRDTYAAESSWAPPWTGEHLRQVRLAAEHTRLEYIRATAEAKTAASHGDSEASGRHEQMAASYLAMLGLYQGCETALANMMNDYTGWSQSTATQRRRAIAADTELRHRHPGRQYPPIRSAEPLASTELNVHGPASTKSAAAIYQSLAELTSGRPAFAEKLATRHRDTQRERVRGEVVLLDSQSLKSPSNSAVLQPPCPALRPSSRFLALIADSEKDREAAE